MRVIVFDIETAGYPEEQLRTVYRPPVWEEFNENCDQRWKEDTRKKKFEEAKADGWTKFVEKSALYPERAQIAAIGLLDERRTPDTAILGVAYGDQEREKSVLKTFWGLAAKCIENGDRIVGHNSRGFDLPFIVKRSWILGVPVPAIVLDRRGYWNQIFVDTQDVWNCGEFRLVGLGTLARILGCGDKPDDCTGAGFAAMYYSGDAEKRATAEAYLRNDLAMTAKCAFRMGIA